MENLRNKIIIKCYLSDDTETMYKKQKNLSQTGFLILW